MGLTQNEVNEGLGFCLPYLNEAGKPFDAPFSYFFFRQKKARLGCGEQKT
jgi:hypothetical protein